MLDEIDTDVTQVIYTTSESERNNPQQSTITLTRIGNINSFAQIEISLNGGTAELGLDFDSSLVFPQIITFEPEQDIQTISFDIFDDSEIEGTEIVNLEIKTIPGSFDTFLGSHSSATLEILDDDEYFIVTELENNNIDGGVGFDILNLDFSLSSNAINSSLTNGKTGQYSDFINTITFTNIEAIEAVGSIYDDVLRGLVANDILLGLEGNDTLIGGNGADRLQGDQDNDSLLGGSGNDTLDGGFGADFLSGQNDDDSLVGSDGNDTLVGGNDADFLLGQNDDDRLLGNNGNDTLNGGLGNDFLSGQNNDDSLVGSDGNDTLNGGLGNDFLSGQNDNDRLFGGDDNDTLRGGNGQDLLSGQNGDDSLEGSDGNDTLRGGNDNDTLIGGVGLDRFFGEAGSDRFRLESTTTANRDIIRDFEDGIDFFELDSLNFGALTITQAGNNTNIIETATTAIIAVVTGIDAVNIDINDFI